MQVDIFIDPEEPVDERGNLKVLTLFPSACCANHSAEPTAPGLSCAVIPPFKSHHEALRRQSGGASCGEFDPTGEVVSHLSD